VTSPRLAVELHAVGGFHAVTTRLPAEEARTRYATSVAYRNGYNACYGDVVHCLAAEPAETVLRLLVEVDGEPVAYEAATLSLLRPGYRVAQLRSCATGTAIDGCVVAVHICHAHEDYIPTSVVELQQLVSELRESRAAAVRPPLLRLASTQLSGPLSALMKRASNQVQPVTAEAKCAESPCASAACSTEHALLLPQAHRGECGRAGEECQV